MYGNDMYFSSDAYERGKQRAIRRNARKGRARRFDTAFPGLREIINKSTVMPQWIHDALSQWGGLTEKQAKVAIKIIDESGKRQKKWTADETERKANAPEWTEGRQEIEGTIRSLKWSTYLVTRTIGSSSLKGLIVLDDGRLIWTTIPNAVVETVESDEKLLRGKRIAMTVTVQPKEEDKTFAFGKRPSKGRIL